MKILHLISDHQVIERTLDVYENVFPGCNEVLVFSNKGGSFNRLKNDYTGRIVEKNNLNAFARGYDYSAITYVIVHYMTIEKADFIKYVPHNIHVCWEIYGYDLYEQFLLPLGYKMYYTSPLPYFKHPLLRRYMGGVMNLYLTIKGVKYSFKSQRKKLFNYLSNRVDSLQYCCKYDAMFVEEFAGRAIPSYEVFNYSLAEVLGELEGKDFFEGKDILIGNSASLSNNHLYILKHLKNIVLPEDTKLILPLSYGGTKEYANKVVEEYKKEYLNELEVISDYMPLHEYNRIFLRLKSVILSAWRQESQGTAIMAFYLGIKVFMSERSPLYKWFVDCGFFVFTIESLDDKSFTQMLTEEEKKHNRQIVLKRYNSDRIAQTLKDNII